MSTGTINGTIVLIKATQQISEKFQKREMVVKTDDQYPQDIMIEFHQDKCSVLDHYSEGERVEIGYNLRGREWISPDGTPRYFITVQGWRISRVDESHDHESAQQRLSNSLSHKGVGVSGEIAQAHIQDGMDNELGDDDLPF